MESLPEKVQAAAAAAGLGAVRRGFRPELDGWIFMVVGFSLTGLVGVPVGAFGDNTIVLGVGLSVVALCVWWWYDLSRRVIGWCYLCDHGILLARRGPVRGRSFRWEQVEHLWPWDSVALDPLTAVYHHSHGFDVQLAGRTRRIRFGEQDKVEATITEVLRQRRLAELRIAGRAEFGPVTVEPTGLRAGSQAADWDDIAVVIIQPNRLQVQDRDGQVLLAPKLNRVPELPVLLSLIAEHGVTCR